MAMRLHENLHIAVALALVGAAERRDLVVDEVGNIGCKKVSNVLSRAIMLWNREALQQKPPTAQ